MQPQPAYLLHRTAYRETSALVDLLTAGPGRIRAVARGVMRPGSRSRHRLQPFAPLHLSWVGEGELKTLRLIESGGPGTMLAGEGLLCGFYANELMTRCLPLELPAERLFVFYGAMLEALPVPARRASALRRFEITLLETLDAEPVFLTDEERPLDPAIRYVYLPHWRRFHPVGAQDEGLDGRALNWLARDDWEAPGLAGVARALTRTALAPLLGDRPLRSRELMQGLLQRRRQRNNK